MYLDYGMEFEELKASMLVAKIGQALDGKMEPLRDNRRRDNPDKRSFYAKYGNKIKRPGRVNK